MFRKLVIVAVVVLVPAVAGAQADRDAIAKQLEANELSMDGTGRLPVPEFVKMFSQIKLPSFTTR